MTKVSQILAAQKKFFETGVTKNIDFRLKQLATLRKAIKAYGNRIIEALDKDFKKPRYETIATEIAVTIYEIDYIIKHLNQWVKPQKVKTPAVHLFAKSYIFPEPYGVSLIIGAWNYPINLVLNPLIGAIAAGNCAVIKPAYTAQESSKILYDMINEFFPQEYIAVVQKYPGVYEEILNQKFDYIFFTGSTDVGKTIMQAASQHLTPVTLELGGKSPAIVFEDADIDASARRIVWGKFINAGQTCIAPDYALVHKSNISEFIDAAQKYIIEFYGANPETSPDFARIIDHQQFDRLAPMLNDCTIVIGGHTDRENRYIAPTVITNVTLEHPSMQQEIFGPILPVLEFNSIDEVITTVKLFPKPLATYIFTKKKSVWQKVISELSFGGGCINDTISHYVSPYLPFGGVGDSGIGHYHGKASFDTFTHYKSVLKKPFFIDIFLRYPPYNKGKVSFIKRYFRFKL
ncbi:MAG: aldehyde dehydrogenase [Spirochaetes bacterium]|nr:aldehyde dehydrogenase [Spirochaetota bacterium]